MNELVPVAVGALIGIPISWLFFQLSLQAETRRTVGDIYDKLIDYRKEHPEVLALSRKWRPECLARIYAQDTDQDRAWAIYYGYVELVLGYASHVLVSRPRALARKAWQDHHRRLTRLLITEHFPIIRDLLRSQFMSPCIKQFIDSEAASHLKWNSEDQHRRIVQVVPEKTE